MRPIRVWTWRAVVGDGVLALLGALAIVGVVGVVGAGEEESPSGGRVALGAGIALVWLSVCAWRIARVSVVLGSDGVVVTNLFLRHEVRWSDILSVEVHTWRDEDGSITRPVLVLRDRIVRMEGFPNPPSSGLTPATSSARRQQAYEAMHRLCRDAGVPCDLERNRYPDLPPPPQLPDDGRPPGFPTSPSVWVPPQTRPPRHPPDIPPSPPPVRPDRSLRVRPLDGPVRAARLAFAALLPIAVVGIVLAATALQRVEAFEATHDRSAEASWSEVDDALRAVSALACVVAVGLIVALSVLTYRARVAVDSLRPVGLRWSARDGIWFWYLPAVNLFLPRQILGEIERVVATVRAGPIDSLPWRDQRTDAVGRWWWGACVLATASIAAAYAGYPDPLLGPDATSLAEVRAIEVADLEWAYVLAIAGCAILLAASVLGIVYVGRLRAGIRRSLTTL